MMQSEYTEKIYLSEQSLRNLWDNIKRSTNSFIFGIPDDVEKQYRKNGTLKKRNFKR